MLSPIQRLVRTSIKRLLYAQMTLREASLVLRGKAKPLIRFTVEGTPPSVYSNFRIRDDQVAALGASLPLPEGFEIAPMACVEGEEPFYCLTLNVYRVSGIVSGKRAEWSIYVRERGGLPRYMIVEAQCDGPSMDPVDLVTRAGTVEHELKDGHVTTRVIAGQGGEFKAHMALPDGPATLTPSRQWVEANDIIYWKNGVSDRAFYGGGLANARMRTVDRSGSAIQDGTPWAAFVDPVPVHVLVFDEPIEFVISPWWNIV
jgi:hypothetical protein